MSVRDAAVRAVAEALYARMWGSDEGVSAEAVAHYRDVAVADAECAIEALVTSADVRAGLVAAECLLHPGQGGCGGATRGVNVRLHPACVLAALGGGE